jgi:hypothetical protein
MWVIVFFIILVIVIFNFIFDQLSKSEFREKHFPKNIIFKEKAVPLPEVVWGDKIPKKIYRCYSTHEEMKKFQRVYMDIKTGPSNSKSEEIFENPYLLVSKGISGIPYIPKQHLKEYFNLSDDWSFVTNVSGGSEWQQYVIASPKGNPILHKVIQQVVSNIEEGIKNKEVYSSGHISVVAMTGPITYSLVIEKYKEKYKDYVRFFSAGLNHKIQHKLIDYKKIMGNKHYSQIKNKTILI